LAVNNWKYFGFHDRCLNFEITGLDPMRKMVEEEKMSSLLNHLSLKRERNKFNFG